MSLCIVANKILYREDHEERILGREDVEMFFEFLKTKVVDEATGQLRKGTLGGADGIEYLKLELAFEFFSILYNGESSQELYDDDIKRIRMITDAIVSAFLIDYAGDKELGLFVTKEEEKNIENAYKLHKKTGDDFKSGQYEAKNRYALIDDAGKNFMTFYKESAIYNQLLQLQPPKSK